MNYKFANFLGVPYRGGNVVFAGDQLLAPASNRVREIALSDASSSTYPFENQHQVQVTALSPDGGLLLTIDTSGRLLLALRHTKVLLHRMRLKSPSQVAAFSPDGSLIAIAVGKVLQIWRCPSRQKVFAPMRLLRSFGGCHADIVAIDWSADSKWIAVGSKDLTARLFSAEPVPGFTPPTLTGHKDALVSVFFASPQTKRAARLLGDSEPSIFTISSDGAIFGYTFTPADSLPAEALEPQRQKMAAKRRRPKDQMGDEDDGDADSDSAAEAATAQMDPNPAAHGFAFGTWSLTSKNFYHQSHSKLTSADYHASTGLLVTSFSTGQFLLHQLPDFDHIQSLSISRHSISTVRFNKNGEWLALGCAALGQLLVWEWRSETYVLKQQGHFYDVSTVSFSPDGTHIASGADDFKVKVWSVASGSCFVTFSDHTAAITGLVFTPNSNALVSSSLDGTCRAFDLVRYRNFRTFVAPEAVQFSSVAVDPSGDVVCAGSKDTFQMFVWSMRTGQLLDIFSGHEGPISSLKFNPSNTTVASASWDKTVRLWDTYSGSKTATEVLQHTHEVVAIAMHPGGRYLAASTLNGEINFWDTQEGAIHGVIEVRKDVRGGRLMSDRRSAGNLASGAFTALQYSADGSLLFAGGSSKWACVYDTIERVLLQRFQLSKNLSLDGVLDQLNSKNLTDAGPLDLLDIQDDEEDKQILPVATPGSVSGAEKLPGTTAGQKRAILQCRDLALSPTGTMWVAATTEGMLLYSLATETLFDPTNLTEDISLPAMHRLIGTGSYLKALLISVRLGDPEHIQHVMYSVPPCDMPRLVAAMPSAVAVPLFHAAASHVASSPHMEYVLAWAQTTCEIHGPTLQRAPRTSVMPAFRALQQGLQDTMVRLRPAVEKCTHLLDYVDTMSSLKTLGDGDVQDVDMKNSG